MAPHNKNTKLPTIVGIKDPKQLQQFKSMLTATGIPDGVSQIIIQNPIEFLQARRVFNIDDTHPTFSVYDLGRVYVPDVVLRDSAAMRNYLFHEFGHFAANATTKGDEAGLSAEGVKQLEAKAEQGAKEFRDRYQFYLRNQKSMDANYDLQSRASYAADNVEPTRALVETQLTPPQSSAAPNSTPAPMPAPSSQPNGLLSLATLGQHIPAAILGALGHAARKV